MEYEIIGAIKIKDGLFLGDEFAAQDLEFVVTNKVNRIINCAGKQIPNHWETVGVQYMTFYWLENDKQIIFDHKDEVMNNTYKFIEEALLVGDSVLVHSVRGHNRSVCIISAYLMRKFRWTLYKTLEFLHSRRPDLEIRANFFNQLLVIENRLTKLGFGAKSYNWKELSDKADTEEILLTNTFINSKNVESADFKESSPEKPKQSKVKWIDNKQEDAQTPTVCTVIIPVYEDCTFKPRSQSQKNIKSAMKGSLLQQDQKPKP